LAQASRIEGFPGAPLSAMATGGPRCDIAAPVAMRKTWTSAAARTLARRQRRHRLSQGFDPDVQRRAAELRRSLELHADLERFAGKHFHSLGAAIAHARASGIVTREQVPYLVAIKRAGDLARHLPFVRGPGEPAHEQGTSKAAGGLESRPVVSMPASVPGVHRGPVLGTCIKDDLTIFLDTLCDQASDAVLDTCVKVNPEINEDTLCDQVSGAVELERCAAVAPLHRTLRRDAMPRCKGRPRSAQPQQKLVSARPPADAKSWPALGPCGALQQPAQAQEAQPRVAHELSLGSGDDSFQVGLVSIARCLEQASEHTARAARCLVTAVGAAAGCDPPHFAEGAAAGCSSGGSQQPRCRPSWYELSVGERVSQWQGDGDQLAPAASHHEMATNAEDGPIEAVDCGLHMIDQPPEDDPIATIGDSANRFRTLC